MNKFDLEKRTKVFALKIIAFVTTLPQTKACAVIEYQLVKAGCSVGANYREANRAESRADFAHKIAIVEKEASESGYWLEICDEAKVGRSRPAQMVIAGVAGTVSYLHKRWQNN